MNLLTPIYSRYSTRTEITKDEYEKKQEELFSEDFAAQFEQISTDGNAGGFYEGKINTYYQTCMETDLATLKLRMVYDHLIAQEKSEQHLNTIKRCIIFFTVLTAIGLFFTAISLLSVLFI